MDPLLRIRGGLLLCQLESPEDVESVFYLAANDAAAWSARRATGRYLPRTKSGSMRNGMLLPDQTRTALPSLLFSMLSTSTLVTRPSGWFNSWMTRWCQWPQNTYAGAI